MGSREDRAGQEERVTDTFAWYLGIDWGTATHEWCMIDADGRICGRREVEHTAGGIAAARQWVHERTGADVAAIAVGLETRHGVLVDTLLDHGFPVFAINPKQLDRFRDRFTAAGAKDDPRDARTIADALRTDRRAFRPVQPEDPRTIRLRELCRLVTDLQEDIGRLTNRLREQLYRVNAPWLALCPAADAPWLWTLLREVPDPDTWARLPRRRIAPVLRTHRIRRLTVEDVIAAVRQPRLSVAAGVADAVATRITALVPQLLLVHEQRTGAQRQIDRLLAELARPADGEPREHRDVEILQSLPGVGRMVTATMLTEAAAAIAARDYATLRAYGGAAPITKRSGKRTWIVHMRYACKPRLRDALFHWARTSIQADAAARAYYDHVRARGHRHARALRSVADRWLRILVAMLRDRSLYDATRYSAAAA
jgi:transposase